MGTAMTYEGFLILVAEESAKNPHMRYGQVWFNVLTTHRSELSHQIVATPIDPYHHELVSDEANRFVRDNW
jgi:hypothetical protein